MKFPVENGPEVGFLCTMPIRGCFREKNPESFWNYWCLPSDHHRERQYRLNETSLVYPRRAGPPPDQLSGLSGPASLHLKDVLILVPGLRSWTELNREQSACSMLPLLLVPCRVLRIRETLRSEAVLCHLSASFLPVQLG